MSMIHIHSDESGSSLTEVQEKDVQPNAVDLRLGKVFKIEDKPFLIDEDQKKHRGSTELVPDVSGYYVLEPGHYEVIMQNEIDVAPGEAGFVITRSTLNRNGVHLTSGLYDSGYKGVMAGVMHVTCGVMQVKPGTRIGQYLNFASETLGSYEGSYGSISEHDKKYA